MTERVEQLRAAAADRVRRARPGPSDAERAEVGADGRLRDGEEPFDLRAAQAELDERRDQCASLRGLSLPALQVAAASEPGALEVAVHLAFVDAEPCGDGALTEPLPMEPDDRLAPLPCRAGGEIAGDEPVDDDGVDVVSESARPASDR